MQLKIPTLTTKLEIDVKDHHQISKLIWIFYSCDNFMILYGLKISLRTSGPSGFEISLTEKKAIRQSHPQRIFEVLVKGGR